ncbi:MAG: ArsR/SmtB family transcription factor [Ignavibacteriales bacterium]
MREYSRYRRDADLLRAIAHPVRLCILNGLMDHECNVGTMQECLGLPQSTVSQHLSVLRARGIVTATRRGVNVCYSVADSKVAAIVRLISDGNGGEGRNG